MGSRSSSSESESNFKLDDGAYLRYIPLLKATLRGEWDAARKFFDQDENAITAPITASSETVLHIAVGTGERAIHFVEKLVDLMPVEALEQRDRVGSTALHTAAWVGNTKAAAVLVRENPDLLYMRDKDFNLPLHLAALNACKGTLLFLLTVTKDDHGSMPFSHESGIRLVNHAISSRLYDVALSLVQRNPQLATSKDDHNEFALGWIAKKASAFPSGSHRNFWQRIIYYYVPAKLQTDSTKYPSRGDLENQVIVQKHVWSIWAQLLKNFSISVSQKLQTMLWKVLEFSVPPIKHIREQKQMHLEALTLLQCVCKEIRSLNDSDGYKLCNEAIIEASRSGIHEVIEEIVNSFPKLIWTKDDDKHGNYSLFERTIIDRQENVFNLIYQMGDYKQYVTTVRANRWDTMLHLAGRLAPQKKLDQVAGAALQMQHELQWFRAVEELVRPGYIEWHNKDAETPAMVFTSEHKNLLVQGQKWMKETSNSCTIPAALIVTVVFAAAITVPGGNNNTGLPMFAKKTAFITFAVSDAISLFTSTTSLLMFLSILTSRCAESDFLYVLPKRLIIGLLTLFLSITTMIVAFSATLYLLFGQDEAWILIPVAVLASLPVTSFASLQFPLLVDLISSTYGSGIFGKQSDRPFY